jgi:hypothetical protein
VGVVIESKTANTASFDRVRDEIIFMGSPMSTPSVELPLAVLSTATTYLN